MPKIDVPRLLGERGPNMTKIRRAIRIAQLARLKIRSTDHDTIRTRIDALLSKVATLRDPLRTNPTDEQKRRRCLALITEAVFLASDDEGRHLLWLKSKCLAELRITSLKPSLLRLALKAFGPYDYDGDRKRQRRADQNVSRDYSSIRRHLSAEVLPPDLVNTWNQPGQGVDASSRPKKQNPYGPRRASLTIDRGFDKKLKAQLQGTKSIALLENTANRIGLLKLRAMVDNPKIVELATIYIRQLATQSGGVALSTAERPRSKSGSGLKAKNNFGLQAILQSRPNRNFTKR